MPDSESALDGPVVVVVEGADVEATTRSEKGDHA